MSTSFDISGLSDISSGSIDIRDVGAKPTAAPRTTARPSTSVGRPAGRTAQRKSASSIDISDSDLSGSLVIDYDDQPWLGPAGGNSRPAPRNNPLSRPGPGGRPTARPKSASSIEISGSIDLSGSIEIDQEDAASPRPGPAARAPAARPTTSGRPPLAPGRPAAALAPAAGRRPAMAVRSVGGSGGGGSSLSISGLSSDELMADLDITGGGSGEGWRGGDGGGGGGGLTEVLSLDGPKITKTRIARAGLNGGPIRESTHTVALSEPESLLSLSGGALGSGNGSLVIEHSNGGPVFRPVAAVQRPASAARPASALAAAAAAAAAASSHSLEYDEGALGSTGMGSASIEYDTSVSYDKIPRGGAATDRRPAARRPAPAAAARYDASRTPSVSGSSSSSSSVKSSFSIGDDDSAPLKRGAARGGPPREPGAAARSLLQPDPLARTAGSVRLSRPQSVGGLTAEPVFASGSSRSRSVVTHSTSGGDSGSRGTGVNLLDASELEAASGELDVSYDAYDAYDARSAGADVSGRVGSSVQESRGRSEAGGRGRGGRRAVDSGGASSPDSRSSGGSSYGIGGGVQLMMIEDLVAAIDDEGDRETSPSALPQPTRSFTPDISYSSAATNEDDNLIASSYSYANDDDLRPLQPSQQQRRLGWPVGGDGSSESGRSGRSSGNKRQQDLSGSGVADGSAEELQQSNSMSRLSGVTAIDSGAGAGGSSRRGAAASRYAGGAGSSSESVVSEPLSGSFVSDIFSGGGRSRRSGHSGTGRSTFSRNTGSSSGRHSRGLRVAAAAGGGAHDLLAGLEMRREGNSSGGSSSSGSRTAGENILTVDQLMAHSIADRSSSGSGAGGRGNDDYSGSQNDIAVELVAEGPNVGGAAAAAVNRLGSGQRELSFGCQLAEAATSAADTMGTPLKVMPSSRSIVERASASTTASNEEPRPGGRGGGGSSRLKGTAAVTTPSDPATVPRPHPPLPDPRVAVVPDSGSYGSVEADEQEDALMAAAVRPTGDEGEDSWRRRARRRQSGLQSPPSKLSSPSLSREDLTRGRRLHRHHHHPGIYPDPIYDPEPESPSGTFDASASRLSHSGALGPVAPGWATSTGGRERGGRGGGGVDGSHFFARPAAAAYIDPNQFSRDSDLSEEFIPSQAMQRGLPEQPVFRPLIPNIPTPRVSTGAQGAVPAFTTRGTTRGTSVSPEPLPAGGANSPPPPEPLSPAVAAAAAPPPPRTAFAATQTDVYTEVVDLDPIPRPGTVKLRTVGMQWGTLNEAATQVAFDPVSERLMPDASAGLHDGAALPPHLRRQLQAHLLQQQQLYGPFTKRGGGGGILQAGADALLLGGSAPLSGIGPGFGILSLAFHSVKTAALLEQLEHSLSTAAAATGVAPPPPPPVYPTPYGMSSPAPHPGMAQYQHPYGWWPQQQQAAMATPLTPQRLPQTPGQAAAAAYAASTAAAAAPPPLPPSPQPANGEQQQQHGTGGPTSGPVRKSSNANWPTVTTVASSAAVTGTVAGASRPTSPLHLASLPSSRLRSASVSLQLPRPTSPPLRDGDGSTFATAVDAAAAAASSRDAVASPGRSGGLSSSTTMAGPKRSPSPVLVSNSYARSAARSMRRGGSDATGGCGGGVGGSSGDYSEDFEEAVAEESGAVGGSGVEDLSRTVGGVAEDVEVEEAVIDEVDEDVEESIVEEEVEDQVDGSSGSGGGGRGGGDSSVGYSEDFETESVATQSQPPSGTRSRQLSRSLSRTASHLPRSSLVASNSRGKLNPVLSGSSFSGRSLLRRGSIVVPTLAPIAGSETISREDEEDGSPPQGSRMLTRVGSIIKSSSGFKRTASISITMADDPMLPNTMPRILPNTGHGASGAAHGGPLGSQPSARQLSTDGAATAAAGGRGQQQHHQPHHFDGAAAAGAAAAGGGSEAQPDTAASAEQQHQQQQQAGPPALPLGAYPTYGYPYPPYPYPTPYGMIPYPPYPSPYPPPPPAASVASVLQYLPPPIPYPYPPYAAPTPAYVPSGAHAAAPAGAAATTAAAARPHSALAGASGHLHPHLNGTHHHVKFADGLPPGGGDAASAQHLQHAADKGPEAATARQLGAAAGTDPSPTGAAAAAAAAAASPHILQQQLQHYAQPPYYGPNPVAAATAAAGIPAAGSFMGYGGYGIGSVNAYSAQNTLQRFGAALSSGAFPGLDPVTVRTIRADLVKTAAAVSGQVGYEDIVAEQGAADEYRAQLARVRARLAAARANLPSVVPSQEKVVLLRTAGAAPGAGVGDATERAAAGTSQPGPEAGGATGGGGSRIVAVSTPAPGSYRYTTLEDTRRLIEATRPYAMVGVN